LNGVTSNSLLPLPIGLFNDGRHYTAIGSTIVSRMVAQELNEVALQNPAIDDRNVPTHVFANLRRARLHPHRRASRPHLQKASLTYPVFFTSSTEEDY